MMNRRHLLAGAAAALPLAGIAAQAKSANLPFEAADSDDPAIAAVRKWVAAREREVAYYTPGGLNWDDDPQAIAISDECERCYDAMVNTVPTSAEGIAMLFMAYLYDRDGYTQGCRFYDPETWGDNEDVGSQRLRSAIWRSPVTREIIARIEQI